MLSFADLQYLYIKVPHSDTDFKNYDYILKKCTKEIVSSECLPNSNKSNYKESLPQNRQSKGIVLEENATSMLI